MLEGSFYVFNGACIDVLSRERFDLNDEDVSPHKPGYEAILEFHQQIGSVIGSTALPVHRLDTGNSAKHLLHEVF